MSDGDHNLDGAYNIRTPDDSVKLYRGWASTYDQTFADAHGYLSPQHVAQAFREQGGQGPVLDIGAGTGLVAEALGDIEIDAIDISQDMLDVAGQKGLYRNRSCADLTQKLDLADASYASLVSAGTFTHGHVGPVCLPELMRVARPDALFVLSINEQIFDEAGFGSAFARLVADGAIHPLAFRRIHFYADGAEHDHAQDCGLLAIFRRI